MARERWWPNWHPDKVDAFGREVGDLELKDSWLFVRCSWYWKRTVSSQVRIQIALCVTERRAFKSYALLNNKMSAFDSGGGFGQLLHPFNDLGLYSTDV
jgi:hypothetical protein